MCVLVSLTSYSTFQFITFAIDTVDERGLSIEAHL